MDAPEGRQSWPLIAGCATAGVLVGALIAAASAGPAGSALYSSVARPVVASAPATHPATSSRPNRWTAAARGPAPALVPAFAQAQAGTAAASAVGGIPVERSRAAWPLGVGAFAVLSGLIYVHFKRLAAGRAAPLRELETVAVPEAQV